MLLVESSAVVDMRRLSWICLRNSSLMTVGGPPLTEEVLLVSESRAVAAVPRILFVYEL